MNLTNQDTLLVDKQQLNNRIQGDRMVLYWRGEIKKQEDELKVKCRALEKELQSLASQSAKVRRKMMQLLRSHPRRAMYYHAQLGRRITNIQLQEANAARKRFAKKLSSLGHVGIARFVKDS